MNKTFITGNLTKDVECDKLKISLKKAKKKF